MAKPRGERGCIGAGGSKSLLGPRAVARSRANHRGAGTTVSIHTREASLPVPLMVRPANHAAPRGRWVRTELKPTRRGTVPVHQSEPNSLFGYYSILVQRCVCVCVCVCARTWVQRGRGVCVLVAQSCLTLCDPTDYSPLRSSVHGILQARIPEWMDCHSPLQRNFPIQGWNPGLLPRRYILYRLSYREILRVLCTYLIYFH